MSDYDDADAEPLLEDESDNTDDDSGNEERNYPIEGHDEVIAPNGQRWKLEPSVQRRRIPSHNILRNPQGATREGRADSPKAAFRLVFTSEICHLVIAETNRRGNSVDGSWEDLEIEEFDAFIGLLIMAGVCKARNESLDDLWSLNYGHPIFRATMSLNRFKAILRFIRFDNFETRERRKKSDKLAPFREFWEMFVKRLPKLYNLGESVTIDEQLVGTRGRCSFKQYIPTKPNKYGIKIFWLADSFTSYPYLAEVYIGRQPGADRSRGSGPAILRRLSQPLENTGRNITVDNFFTDFQTAKDLLAKRVTLVGTVRKNKRDIPKDFQPHRNRPVESSLFGFDGQLTIVSYVPKKNRAVILLSTMHHDKSVGEKGKPELLLYYNQTKGGVDNMDHLVSLYSVRRKTWRWPLTMFFNCIDVGCLAAYTLFTDQHRTWNIRCSHKRKLFLREVAESLTKPWMMQRASNPRVMQRGVPLAMKLLGVSIPPPTTRRPDGKGRCHLCPRASDRKVKTVCENCDQPSCPRHLHNLCQNCFEDAAI